MTELEKIREWARFFEVSQPSYRFDALRAVFRNDGEKVLAGVLRELKLERTEALVKAMENK